MTNFQAIILGVIQGITEFLPISSSGHLVLAPFFFGWNIPEEQIFPFDVLVQMGTLAAVIVYFWRDLVRIGGEFVAAIWKRKPFGTLSARQGWYLLLASLPVGLVGVLVKPLIERAFNSVTATAYFLFGSAFLLVLSEKVGKNNRDLDEITWLDALWIGAFQALAVFPGISRSGATITGGMTRHLHRKDAGRFSFILSIPVMLVAGLYSLYELVTSPGFGLLAVPLAIGLVVAAVVGYFSIGWLLSFLQRRSLTSFAVYCASLGALTLILTYAF